MHKLSNLAINGEGFAFDTTTGQCFLVNRTAQSILEGFRGGKSEAEIARQLTDEYGLPVSQAFRDLADFCARLRTFGLV